MKLTDHFQRFFAREQSGAIVLLACSLAAIAIANSPFGTAYAAVWTAKAGPLTVAHWINDALMAVFFLLIGLELERELYVGELSDFRTALLPVVAAVGGMALPALAHFALNAGLPSQGGFGIPMATDIAFVIGVLALLGTRVPAALKVFVVAFAVIDDLGAIIVIALFYTSEVSLPHLAGAGAVFAGLVVLNRLRVMSLWPYLASGAGMWVLMLLSGVHATIAGVLLAFAIPFTARAGDPASPSSRLEGWLHRPVAFAVLPLFALANAGVVFPAEPASALLAANSLGILLGLILGKPAGVLLASAAAVALGVCKLPDGCGWRHLAGAGMLGGIGFTMSIFITHLAFAGSPQWVNDSKMAVLLASIVAGVAGYAWLRLAPPANDPAGGIR